MFKWLPSLILAFSLPAFAGSDPGDGHPRACRFNYDFTHGQTQNFRAVFRDIPEPIFREYLRRQSAGGALGPRAPLANPPASYAEDESHWLLNSGIFKLPDGLPGTGFLLQGDNHSDDLDMYLVRLMGPREGFRPNTNYKVRVTVDLAGDAPHGAIGVGGDPELRIQVVLNSSFNPTRFIIDNDQIVRHPQSPGRFPHAEVNTNAVCAAGSASMDPCPENERIRFELKKGKSSRNINIRTDSRGQFWLMVGSHSPFESFSGIYYTRVQLQVVQGPGFSCNF